MASGKTHDRITKIMTPFVLIFFFTININVYNNITDCIIFTTLGVATYIFGGYMFSGDLDTKSREFKRWGYLKFIWIPYQKLFCHRSIFTHGFLLGPLIRILYLYIISLIICSIMYSLTFISFSTIDIIKNTFSFIFKNQRLLFNIFIALFLGSGLHTIVDITFSYFKRYFSPKKNVSKRYSKKSNKKRRPLRI